MSSYWLQRARNRWAARNGVRLAASPSLDFDASATKVDVTSVVALLNDAGFSLPATIQNMGELAAALHATRGTKPGPSSGGAAGGETADLSRVPRTSGQAIDAMVAVERERLRSLLRGETPMRRGKQTGW